MAQRGFRSKKPMSQSAFVEKNPRTCFKVTPIQKSVSGRDEPKTCKSNTLRRRKTPHKKPTHTSRTCHSFKLSPMPCTNKYKVLKYSCGLCRRVVTAEVAITEECPWIRRIKLNESDKLLVVLGQEDRCRLVCKLMNGQSEALVRRANLQAFACKD